MPSSQVTAALVFSVTFAAAANPTGGTVQSGSATFNTTGSTLTVNAGNNSVINWQSFNIGAGERTIFNQPSASSVVWNRINDPNPSQIFGTIQANGIVVLLNSSGFYFGPGSFVSAAGLVVSSANILPPQNGGGAWTFNGPPPLANIVNYGQIKIGNGGDCFLIADQVENHGDIEAPGGEIGLAAGQTVTLSERPDGRGMTMQVTLPQGSVDNHGNIIADGGTIALNAQVVNEGGILQANSVKNETGEIDLIASGALNLESGSQISASGDTTAGGSAGGTVTLKSGDTFSDEVGSQINVLGGANGGDGGNVELSAPTIESLNTAMDSGAQSGWQAGSLLLDPTTINLNASGANGATVPGTGTVSSGSTPATLNLNVNTAFANLNFSSIILQATSTINLSANTVWNLSASTGVKTGQLKLEAGGGINLATGSEIIDGNNWSIGLYAGNNFTQNTISQGTGSIVFTGTSAIQTAGGNISLQAGNLITLGSGPVQSVGNAGIAGNALLEAGGTITLGNHSSVSSVDAGSVTIDAGYNFAQGKVTTGASSLLLSGNSFIQTQDGGINLAASDNLTVGSGYVVTTAGGSINAHALTGNINAGSDPVGYTFNPDADTLATAYTASGVGGISTENGGNDTLIAGGNITCILPGATPISADIGGVGAYGRTSPGNVTVVAGGDVTGNYLVADGIGSIYAGVKMDANGNPITSGSGYLLGATGSAGNSSLSPNLALNLITGGWNVTAALNIDLQEVRNPNGVFQTSGTFAHVYDYASSDYVNLNAGNQVELGSAALPRLDTIQSSFQPPIYPGSLTINAGAGGVLLGVSSGGPDDLILYPSPTGSLTINTTGGGSLVGNLPESGTPSTPQLFDIIISDSGSDQYTGLGSFGTGDHAANPIHIGSEVPVQLNISGDMDLVQLDSPEVSHINVVGNINNSSYQGMNLSASDTTSITVGALAKANMEQAGVLNPATDGGLTVGGNITDRGSFTSVDLSSVVGAGTPDFSQLAYALTAPGQPTASTLANSFYYNPTTHVLTYQLIQSSTSTLAQILSLLENLTVQKQINGVLQWQDPLHTIPATTTISAITPAAAQALINEYTLLGVPPSGNAGFIIGGGGDLQIRANNVDLGSSPGIESVGVGFDTTITGDPLAKLFTTGANIDLDLTGDLTMYSSSIATLNGSAININAGGSVSAGSPEFNVTANGARGIYTTGQGDCTVIANGDIDVNGSRIAAYDGGNVTVISLNGDVNAGSGGNGNVNLNPYVVNPVTRAVTATSATIPGSGIMAATFPNDPLATVGNILVETPNGDINAAVGGVVQLPYNKKPSPNAQVELLAGYELLDQNNHLVDADDLAAGTPVQVSANRDILATDSGVIAENATLEASGNVEGLIISQNNINLVAQSLTDVTALGASINVSAQSIGSTVTLIGTESVNTGGTQGGDILSANANGGGSSFAAGTSANSTSAASSAQSVAEATKATTTDTSNNGDSDQLDKQKHVALAQKISRVTVLLPGKNN